MDCATICHNLKAPLSDIRSHIDIATTYRRTSFVDYCYIRFVSRSFNVLTHSLVHLAFSLANTLFGEKKTRVNIISIIMCLEKY